MDQPTDEELVKKLLDFHKLRNPATPTVAPENIPTTPYVPKTDAQKILELQLDVGRLIASVVDMDRVIETQATLLNLMVKAMVHINNKVDGRTPY